MKAINVARLVIFIVNSILTGINFSLFLALHRGGNLFAAIVCGVSSLWMLALVVKERKDKGGSK